MYMKDMYILDYQCGVHLTISSRGTYASDIKKLNDIIECGHHVPVKMWGSCENLTNE